MPEKQRSNRALDFFNFFNAGIQTGLGPFMAIYYGSERHWNPGEIGILLALQSLSGVVLQSFTGAFVDKTEHKRSLAALAALVIAGGCAGIALIANFAWQCVIQIIIGIGTTVFPAASSAFALGLVPKDQISPRIARNERFTHGGNVIFAGLACITGALVPVHCIFFVAGAFASGMAFCSRTIREEDIDHRAAREEEETKDGEESKQKSYWDVFGDARVLTFTAAVVLFNVANASTLPLVGQLLSQQQKRASVWQTSACVALAEVVMVAVAWTVANRVDTWGRKPLFLTAFAMLALRNGLTVLSHNEWYLISLQALDGVAAGLYGVLLKLVISDLARGTGRFNFLQGSVQSAMGLGAFLSNGFFGWLAHAASYNASFLGMAAAACAGGTLYLLKMPETVGRETRKGGVGEPEAQPQEAG